MTERERGFSSVAMVMMVLSVALLMFSGLDRQLSASLRQAHDERLYLLAYNRAASSLEWGRLQSWPELELDWLCQTSSDNRFHACTKEVAGAEYSVLRGSALVAQHSVNLHTYVLTRAISVDEQSNNGPFRLQTLPSGWLDFCPAYGGEC